MDKQTALKILKDIHDTELFSVRTALETLIPELKESEDKNFITILINGFKAMLENKNIYFAGEPIKNIINYLEEQKPIEDAAKEVTKDKESAEKFLKTAGIVDESGNLAEIYRSEQESTEWSEKDKTIIESACYALKLWGHTKLAEMLKSLRPQPKHEWSGEDAYMLGKCINAASGYYSPEDKQPMKDWLKSLPERFNLQPKQEHCDYITPHKKFFQWIYNRLIDVHHENPNVDYMRSFKERIDNLSFGETTNRKPGEEQMEGQEEPKYYQHFDPDC